MIDGLTFPTQAFQKKGGAGHVPNIVYTAVELALRGHESKIVVVYAHHWSKKNAEYPNAK